jgi:hypothetical protein
MDIKEVLVPCPLCGGEVEVHSVVPHSMQYRREQRKVYFVIHRCSVLREREVMTKDFDTEEEAIADWNLHACGWIEAEDRLPDIGDVCLCRIEHNYADDGWSAYRV